NVRAVVALVGALVACAGCESDSLTEKNRDGVDAGADGGCSSSKKRCSDPNSGKPICVPEIGPAWGCSAETCEPCEPLHGNGACVDAACVVVTCESQWHDCDCDPHNGCET